jgi:hypothetical protein
MLKSLYKSYIIIGHIKKLSYQILKKFQSNFNETLPGYRNSSKTIFPKLIKMKLLHKGLIFSSEAA